MKPTYEDLQSQLTALTTQLESVVAEYAALKDFLHSRVDESICDKHVKTPATSAFLAEVRNEAGARAVELFSKTLGSPYKVRDEKCYEDGFTRAIEIVRDTQAPRFAAQLRKGVQS